MRLLVMQSKRNRSQLAHLNWLALLYHLSTKYCNYYFCFCKVYTGKVGLLLQEQAIKEQIACFADSGSRVRRSTWAEERFKMEYIKASDTGIVISI